VLIKNDNKLSFDDRKRDKAGYKKVVGLNRRRLLERTAIVWLVLQLLVLACALVFSGINPVAVIGALCIAVAAWVLLASRQGISVYLLGSVLLLSIALPIMVVSYASGGIHSPFLIIILFFPVAAFMMVSRRIGWIATFLVGVFFLYLGALEEFGTAKPAIELGSTELVVARTISFVVVMFCISGIGWYYSKLFDRFYLSLKKSNAELIQTAEYKSQFLSSMSHEFRTPLNAIIGFSRRLHRTLQGALSDKDLKGLEAITRNGETMQILVNDVLDMAKIESGEISVSRKVANIRELVKSLVYEFSVSAEQKQLTLNYHVACAEAEVQVYTDVGLLKKILANLVSNAIKYTEQGHVGIHVHCEQSPLPFLVIDINDTGRGIAKEDIPRLFLRFSKVERDVRSNIVGAGLGLALSYELLKILKAEIQVDSVLGEGSTFSVRLPLKEAIP